MKRDFNHEGYRDPTATEAVRRASRNCQKERKHNRPLTYQIGEIRSFTETRRALW